MLVAIYTYKFFIVRKKKTIDNSLIEKKTKEEEEIYIYDGQEHIIKDFLRLSLNFIIFG